MGIKVINSVPNKQKKINAKNTLVVEAAIKVKEVLQFSTSTNVDVVGKFKNGDVEVSFDGDSKNTFRVPKKAFDKAFTLVKPTENTEVVFEDLLAEFTAKQDGAKDYNAEKLGLLCKHFEIEYTNAGNAKKDLAALDLTK